MSKTCNCDWAYRCRVFGYMEGYPGRPTHHPWCDTIRTPDWKPPITRQYDPDAAYKAYQEASFRTKKLSKALSGTLFASFDRKVQKWLAELNHDQRAALEKLKEANIETKLVKIAANNIKRCPWACGRPVIGFECNPHGIYIKHPPSENFFSRNTYPAYCRLTLREVKLWYMDGDWGDRPGAALESRRQNKQLKKKAAWDHQQKKEAEKRVK